MYIIGGVSQTSLLADFWSWTPTGLWNKMVAASGNDLLPPIARHCTTYDSDRDAVWVWMGTYGYPNATDNPAVSLFKYSWYGWANGTLGGLLVFLFISLSVILSLSFMNVHFV